jgi:aminoglycoside phosphotransferase family enzyme
LTEELVAFLSLPETHDDRPHIVEVRETHMSWVFLAGAHVYKLKKPLRTAYLDFSTLAARERNCRQEVRLNRRLAADIYLGVVAITRDADGTLALGGSGETVDWLVKMRRLPADRMLDAAIRSGSVTADDIETVATLLVRFFSQLEPAGNTVADYLARLEYQLHLDRAILCDARFDLPPGLAERVLDRLMNAVKSGDGKIEGALQAKRIVEGHGDLRPEHVCLLDPPVIIDCLEFDRDLRLVDPFDDIAYLAMECGFIGAPWIGEILMARIADGLGVRPPDTLIAFYTAFRACLRARLSLAHLLDPVPRTPEKWLPQAIAYLEIADRESAKLTLPEAR